MSLSLEQRCVHAIRTLSMDAVQKANSGHPGMPMGMADVAFVLWTEFLKYNPSNPNWADRDRFILSAGHGSMLLYSLLHLTGYNLSMDELKNFRQWDSLTPGHPEVGLTPGVETTTGPLGQGFANGAGMALAEAHLAARYNRDGHKVIDHYTYAIVSDGDLMEGVTQEAASLAGHLKLGKLIYFYDDNKITIDGSTDLAFTEDVQKRFEAYGWHCIPIDGHNRDEIRRATLEAQSVTDKPSLILCRTHIGFGSPNKQDSASSHGSPLGDDEITLTKKAYGVDASRTFHIDEDVLAFYRQQQKKGEAAEKSWNDVFSNYKAAFPDVSAELEDRLSGKLPQNWDEVLPEFKADSKGMATRKASGMVLDELTKHIPSLLGGSADLSGSNLTKAQSASILQAGSMDGTYIHYGVREHAMGSMMNGMALHGGILPFGGTFLVFSDYCRPAIRLAALSHIRSVFVFTHDSIGLGEDGPTHQPIEHLASLRAMINVKVFRPADANETAYAWRAALENSKGPSCLALTRQNLPTLDRSRYASAEGTLRGAYVLNPDVENPEAIIMATGSEVEIALAASEKLSAEGLKVRVVSMPSFELFEAQDEAYRREVLPDSVKARVAVEAGVPMGWEHYTGSRDGVVGMRSYGASAPFETLYEKFGLTPEAVVSKVKELLVK
jgi:transketolase